MDRSARRHLRFLLFCFSSFSFYRFDPFFLQDSEVFTEITRRFSFFLFQLGRCGSLEGGGGVLPVFFLPSFFFATFSLFIYFFFGWGGVEGVLTKYFRMAPDLLLVTSSNAGGAGETVNAEGGGARCHFSSVATGFLYFFFFLFLFFWNGSLVYFYGIAISR